MIEGKRKAGFLEISKELIVSIILSDVAVAATAVTLAVITVGDQMCW